VGGAGAGVARRFGTVSRARQILGKTGEDLACRELERRGYAIVARRYRQRSGELDIVARDGRAFGEAADAITGFKRRRITQLARDYIMRHHVSNCPCRFDVVSIQFDSGEPVIEVIQNAFDA